MKRIILAGAIGFALSLGGCSDKASDVTMAPAVNKVGMSDVMAQAQQTVEVAGEASKNVASDAKNALSKASSDIKSSATEAASKMQDKAAEVTKSAKSVKNMIAPAKDAVAYKEGTHYEVLPTKVPTITPGKVEVTEVFAYSCGHCYKFEPYINSWKKTLPDYAEVVQSPAVWRKVMEAHARILYTAKALSVFDEVHARTFSAIHEERRRLTDEDDIAKIFAEFGIDKAKFKSTFNSFGVTSQVNLATSRARGMRIQGTPELVVDGRFRISTNFSGVGSQPNMLKVARYLVDQVNAGAL